MTEQELEKAAIEARRQYNREYRKKNAEHLKQYHKEWTAKNPDKVKASRMNYWKKKALAMAAEGGAAE